MSTILRSLLISLLLLVLGAARGLPGEAARDAGALAPVAADTSASSGTLRVGYSALLFSEVNMQDARAATRAWVDTVLRHSIRQYDHSETIILDGLDAVAQAIEKGQVDVFILMSYEFLRLEKKTGLIPFVVGVNDTPGYNRFCVLVRKDSGIRDLAQLRGKRMLIDFGLSGEIPRIWLEVTLADRQLLPPNRRFFSSLKGVTKASAAILPLFFKQTDACLVRRSAFDTMKELNPQVGAALTPLATSEELIGSVACYQPKFDRALVPELQRCILSLNNEPEGRQILTLFNTDRLIPFDEKLHLEPLRQLLGRFDAIRTAGRKREAAAAGTAVARQ